MNYRKLLIPLTLVCVMLCSNIQTIYAAPKTSPYAIVLSSTSVSKNASGQAVIKANAR